MRMLQSSTRQWMLLGVAVILLGVLPPSAPAQDTPFSVARLVVCEDVQDRTPVNVTDVFPAGTDTVYCFLEARDILADVEITVAWYYEDQEVARVPLSIGQGPRWRTYSSKKTMSQKGNWKVYLLDAGDNILASVQFVIE